MGFTNSWDDTFPPDTQAANQLGADLRNFRVDTRERMSAMSGNDADKPNFEVGFAGVLWFATDTGKIYRWNGSSWLDVTALIIAAVTPTSLGLAAVATSGSFADMLNIAGLVSITTEAVGGGSNSGTYVKLRLKSDSGAKYFELAIGLGTGKNGTTIPLPAGYSSANAVAQAAFKYSASTTGNGMDNPKVVISGLNLTEVGADRVSASEDTTTPIAMWICIAWNSVT